MIQMVLLHRVRAAEELLEQWKSSLLLRSFQYKYELWSHLWSEERMQLLWVSIDAALAENFPGPGPSNLSGVGGWEIGLGREDTE